MNKKLGLSLTSLVLYVSLFFVFSVFVITMSTNMNYKAMQEKADIYIYEQFNKLQYNIIASAKKSKYVDQISKKIVFSNEDEYYFDSEKKAILKNDGILIKGVESFEVIEVNNLDNSISKQIKSNIDDKSEYICIKIKLKKYGKDITKELFVTLGDGVV